MAPRRPEKQTTIYAIWDMERGEWWVTKMYAGGLKCSWTAEYLAVRAFNEKQPGSPRLRFHEQSRFILVSLFGALVAGAGVTVYGKEAA